MEEDALKERYGTLTPEQALEKLSNDKESGDAEDQHYNADDTLCALLLHLGHSDIVNAWHKIPKWYA